MGCSVQDRSSARPLGGPLRLDDGRHRPGGVPEVADLPGTDQVGERPEGDFQVDGRVVAVDLVNVDPVRAQAPERVLDLGDDPTAAVPPPVGALAHRHVHLGGQHDVVAPAGDGLAYDLLGLAGGVNVGSVDEVDARVDGPVDDAGALFVVLGAPPAEHHGAEAQGRDSDAGAPERSKFHGQFPFLWWLMAGGFGQGWTSTLRAVRSAIAR